ncbi:MAG TPA: hypothetical protein VIX37_24525 [Candidatus Sulfotelmatobacter sp.]
MAGSKARNRIPQIPRIPEAEASAIFNRCEHILEDSHELLANLHSAGIAELFARLDDLTLRLVIQPDSWGERTRARLMSDLTPALCAESGSGSTISIESIVQVTNVVMPCLLLELGRRKEHIQVEFPLNPSDPTASFRFSVGPASPMHSLTTDRLLRLVNDAGEALVGLCYFGDQESRERIETQLNDTAQL